MSIIKGTVKTATLEIDNGLNIPQISTPSNTTNKLYNTSSSSGILKWGTHQLVGFPKSIQKVSSTGHYAIPSGTTQIHIKVVGGGGGGGGPAYEDDVGGGGGSGSYTEVNLDTSTFISYGSDRSYIYVSLGSGGAGGTGTNNGSAGTGSTVRFSNGSTTTGATICTTNGGSGGIQGNYYGLGGSGGSEGSISIGNGYKIPGRPGQNGIDKGTNITNRTGTLGGSSVLGKSGRGGIPYYGATGINGERGGGGGGGFYHSSGSGAGTAGGDGYCIIIFS